MERAYCKGGFCFTAYCTLGFAVLFQIQSTADKNFKKGNKTVTVSKNKTKSKTLTKLKSKKKYYVRIRTYKTVKGTKYYSGWKKYSKAIKVK